MRDNFQEFHVIKRLSLINANRSVLNVCVEKYVNKEMMKKSHRPMGLVH